MNEKTEINRYKLPTLRIFAPLRATLLKCGSHLALLALLPVCAMATGNPPAVSPVDLKTEALETPLGLDTVKPRFSWRMEPGRAVCELQSGSYRFESEIMKGNKEKKQ